jgi:hypothetical protein
MRLWARVVLVALANLALLAAIWWSWHPRVGDGNTVPGRINVPLTVLATVLFLGVLLQVSAKIPFTVFCVAFVLVPCAVYLSQYAGVRVWTTEVMQNRGEVEVTQVERLFNGPSRVMVRDHDDRELVAYSTIGTRGPNDYTYDTITAGQRFELTSDPTGLAVNRLQPVGYDPADHGSGLWTATTLASLGLLELCALSALTRRRSQIAAVDDKDRFGGRRKAARRT